MSRAIDAGLGARIHELLGREGKRGDHRHTTGGAGNAARAKTRELDPRAVAAAMKLAQGTGARAGLDAPMRRTPKGVARDLKTLVDAVKRAGEDEEEAGEGSSSES